MPQAVILAAGSATRAQVNKLLLPYKESFLLEFTIKGILPFVSQVIVVTGHYHQATSKAIAHIPNVVIVYNANYDQGMFSSIKTALPYLHDDFFILPGDCPFVTEQTFIQLLATEGKIRVPCYQARKGHPIFIKHELLSQLKDEPDSSNLKTFRDRIGFRVIPVNDSNILIDIDTIEDYQSLPSN